MTPAGEIFTGYYELVVGIFAGFPCLAVQPDEGILNVIIAVQRAVI